MVLALILGFDKLSSYLIICITLLFHRFSTSSLSYSTGAKENGAYLKGINFCAGGGWGGGGGLCKFSHSLRIFSHVKFSKFWPNITFYSSIRKPGLVTNLFIISRLVKILTLLLIMMMKMKMTIPYYC